MLTRRKFLQSGGLALAGAASLPLFLGRTALAAQVAGTMSDYGPDTILVVIQMSGGNDGLNTVVPYGLDGYRAARGAIGIPEANVLPLTERVGLHPDMGKLFERYQAGQVAIVQGAGYPNPNLSHFRSMDIWHTAVPDAYAQTGWLAGELAATQPTNPLYAVSVTDSLIPALAGAGTSVPAIPNVQAYQLRTDTRYPADRAAQIAVADWSYRQDYSGRAGQGYIAATGANALASTQMVQDGVAAYRSTVEYPNFALGASLKSVAQMIAAGLGTRIFYTSFGSFDTHSAQPNAQARLLGGFSNSVDAFLRDLEGMGQANNVLLMSFSEFGRRVQENGSQGTDHGTAGPMFVIGSRVTGGLYGEYPSLTKLDENRNLRYQVDFRSVYGTVLEGWLGVDQSVALGGRYDSVGFV